MATDDLDIFSSGNSVLLVNVIVNGKKGSIYIDESGKIGDTCEGTNAGLKSEAEFIIDGNGAIATPGFTNTHTHAAMSLLRGYADDMHLQQWLNEKIWPLEAHLTGEDVYRGTKLACIEMIRSGTTAFNDMYFFMDQTAKAADEMGMKAVLSHGFIDFGDEGKREQEIKATEALYDHVKGMNNPRIKMATGPHAPYTVSKEGLSWCAEFSKEKDVHLHIHLSETETEVQGCIDQHGMKPAKLLEECGCLTEKTIAAHCCWLDDAECELLGKYDVSASHNPASNMKLATGRAMPYQQLRDAGANVTLGTDGCSSNNNLDILEEVKFAALLQKFFWKSDTVLPANEAFDMIASAGANALGFGSGIIEKGAPADIVLIRTDVPCNTPLYNPVSNIIYSCNSNAVDTVLCDGRILMHEGIIPGEEEILKKASETAFDLVKRKEDAG